MLKFPEKDYYMILGVPPIASLSQIKQAYKRLSKKYHPDVAKDKQEAERMMKLLNEAYEVLSNPKKRQSYDKLPIFNFKGLPKRYQAIKLQSKPVGRSRTPRAPSVFERILNPFAQMFKRFKGQDREIDPAKAKEHFEFAMFYISHVMSASSLEAAAKELEVALQFDPTAYEIYYNLGLIYYKLGKFDKAVEYLKSASRIKNTVETAVFLKLLGSDILS